MEQFLSEAVVAAGEGGLGKTLTHLRKIQSMARMSRNAQTGIRALRHDQLRRFCENHRPRKHIVFVDFKEKSLLKSR